MCLILATVFDNLCVVGMEAFPVGVILHSRMIPWPSKLSLLASFGTAKIAISILITSPLASLTTPCTALLPPSAAAIVGKCADVDLLGVYLWRSRVLAVVAVLGQMLLVWGFWGLVGERIVGRMRSGKSLTEMSMG